MTLYLHVSEYNFIYITWYLVPFLHPPPPPPPLPTTTTPSALPPWIREGIIGMAFLCPSVCSVRTHKWVVRWLRIMDSSNVFEWELFCESHKISLFTSVGQCAEPITQPCRLVKVIIESHKFEPWISCLLHISFTPGRIFIKLWSNVCLSERIAEPITQPCWLKIKVIIEGHQFKPWILCLLHISFTPWKIFSSPEH